MFASAMASAGVPPEEILQVPPVGKLQRRLGFFDGGMPRNQKFPMTDPWDERYIYRHEGFSF